MAKSNTILVKLVSTADTGYFYVAKKNPGGRSRIRCRGSRGLAGF